MHIDSVEETGIVRAVQSGLRAWLAADQGHKDCLVDLVLAGVLVVEGCLFDIRYCQEALGPGWVEVKSVRCLRVWVVLVAVLFVELDVYILYHPPLVVLMLLDLTADLHLPNPDAATVAVLISPGALWRRCPGGCGGGQVGWISNRAEADQLGSQFDFVLKAVAA